MDRTELITAPDQNAIFAAREQWRRIAKPVGSLGVFEDMVVKIAGIQGGEPHMDRRCAVIMCADCGAVEENITQSGQEVTSKVARSIAEGGSNVNILAHCVNADVFAVDVGINGITPTGVINRKVMHGTRNMTKTAAMSKEQAVSAVTAGIDTVRELKDRYDIIAVGEMGIGNTSAAAAVTCALTGRPPAEMTGRGAGADDDMLRRKIGAVGRALEINRPDPNDPTDVLAKVGGLDICGMTGLFLGGAVYKVPVVIDGVVSAAAAACAYLTDKRTADYMLPSHMSAEKASAALFDIMGLEPPIRAGMRLGEGTGALMLLPLIDQALALYRSAHTFESLDMERYKL
ncbi:MAG: nicotinate-nucleotide--dimethylbenzimidazole phosphoribosyltransferase [Oscillospiraceae bacterium]|nr:nicotinate-nucleotide--dimethylbenzimidazole phosphoribosyltransferase [Oscillospiraceae bacterium]